MVNCLVFAIFYYRPIKIDVYKTFTRYRNQCCWKSSIRMFLKLQHCQIIWYLFAGLKIIILCSVDFIWFVKHVFSAERWFVETSNRIMKYESRVVKSNPVTSRVGITMFSESIIDDVCFFNFK